MIGSEQTRIDTELTGAGHYMECTINRRVPSPPDHQLEPRIAIRVKETVRGSESWPSSGLIP